ncbi:MAG TPA: hypothetical protein VIW73_12970 [Candidatus Cybelea sp.]
MSPRLAAAICALYPRRWRARYGEEFLALLRMLPPSPATIVDGCIPAARLQAPRAIVAVIILVGAALPFALAVHRPAAPAHRAHAFTALPPEAACRAYSSVNRVGYIEERRCLD